MTGRPLVLLLAALVLAVCCLGVGTLRGSFRLWLVGWVLAVVALVLAYVGVHATRRPSAPYPGQVSLSVPVPGRASARAGGTRLSLEVRTPARAGAPEPGVTRASAHAPATSPAGGRAALPGARS